MRRTKAEAQATREAICAAALDVFYERGVAGTTLEQIAHTAGVTRGAIYHHFRNKAELFEAIHQQAVLPMQDVANAIFADDGPNALQRLERFCVESLLRLHEDTEVRRRFAVILLKCEATPDTEALLARMQAAKEESTQRLAAFFTRKLQRGVLTPESNPRLLALGLHDYMTGLFTGYLRSPGNYRMPDDAHNLVRHYFAPLRA